MQNSAVLDFQINKTKFRFIGLEGPRYTRLKFLTSIVLGFFAESVQAMLLGRDVIMHAAPKHNQRDKGKWE